MWSGQTQKRTWITLLMLLKRKRNDLPHCIRPRDGSFRHRRRAGEVLEVGESAQRQATRDQNLQDARDEHCVHAVTKAEWDQKLAEFGKAVLEEHREALTDLDGGWIQDTAEEIGLLVRVTVDKPCGEYCQCADYGEFPLECLRYPEIDR